jgi:predicted ArsR family transcriptional regulator
MSGGVIDIEEFENADGKFDEPSDAERVVRFLDEHDDRAWTAAAVAERLGMEPDAVDAALSRLRRRSLVRHKQPYWAITDDETRLASAYRLHQYHETTADRYGDEQLEELQTDGMEPVE